MGRLPSQKRGREKEGDSSPFQRVRLLHNLNLKGWNSRVHRVVENIRVGEGGGDGGRKGRGGRGGREGRREW